MMNNNQSTITNDPWLIVYRSSFGALSMADKLRRETIYERVTREARLKNVVLTAAAWLTMAAACGLCVMASYYR